MIAVPGKYTKFRLIFLVTIVCSIFITRVSATSQGLSVWNPADRDSPWTSAINPAVISFQDAKISAGLKVFHLGFVPDASFSLRENHLNVSLPFYLPYQIGVGFDIRYFKGGIFSELASALLLSRELFDRFSYGLKIGLEHRSFSRDNFNLIDLDDPVLAGSLGTTSLNLGFGVYWNPGKLTIGVGIDHANRADVGLLNQAILPREISAAVGYKIGLLTPTFVLHDDGTYKGVGFSLAAAPSKSTTIRFSYENDMPFKVEASFNLSKDNSLRYGVDLPTEGTRGLANGSHELDFTRILAREPDAVAPEILFSTRELQVLEETVLRSLPSELQPETLSQLDELAPEYLSSVGQFDDTVIITAGALSEFETEPGRGKRFQQLALEIYKLKQHNSNLKIMLRAEDHTLKDAWLLKNFFLRNEVVTAADIPIIEFSSSEPADLYGFESGYMTRVRKNLQLSSENLEIQLVVPGKTRRTQGWRLQIQDSKGKVVKNYFAKGNLPYRLSWDWHDYKGTIVEPGRYTFHFKFKTRSGKTVASKINDVKVTHIKRNVMLKFRSKPEPEEVSSGVSMIR